MDAPAEMVALVTEYTASAVPKMMAQELSNAQAKMTVLTVANLRASVLDFMELCQILYLKQHTAKTPPRV